MFLHFVQLYHALIKMTEISVSLEASFYDEVCLDDTIKKSALEFSLVWLKPTVTGAPSEAGGLFPEVVQ